MTFYEVYQAQLEAGLRLDHAQQHIAGLLSDLGNALVEYERMPSIQRWFHQIRKGKSNLVQIKGLYLWGGVGRGKTFLMDLFVDWLPIDRKRRLHFHHFMQLIHHQLAELEGQTNPLKEIAKQFSAQTKVLCFDEFFVSDIGDAMILAELLDALFERGLVLIATSNTAPQDLYENGLQRDRFKPAIALLEQHTDVVEIGGDLDYRLEMLHQGEIFRLTYPASKESIEKDQQMLLQGSKLNSDHVVVNDREIATVFQGEGMAAFTFDELCNTPRNAEDYIELARIYHTIVLYDIPIMDANLESAARRFVALIDEFYDRNVNVIFYAEAPIVSLYQGDLLATPFERTISRVIEMQSDNHLAAAHRA